MYYDWGQCMHQEEYRNQVLNQTHYTCDYPTLIQAYLSRYICPGTFVRVGQMSGWTNIFSLGQLCQAIPSCTQLYQALKSYNKLYHVLSCLVYNKLYHVLSCLVMHNSPDDANGDLSEQMPLNNNTIVYQDPHYLKPEVSRSEITPALSRSTTMIEERQYH